MMKMTDLLILIGVIFSISSWLCRVAGVPEVDDMVHGYSKENKFLGTNLPPWIHVVKQPAPLGARMPLQQFK